jgi:hypothetical protein
MAGSAPMLLVRVTEACLVQIRTALASVANEVELRLKTYEARHDPDRDQWVKSARQAIDDGSIAKGMEMNPGPEEIVERWLTKSA